MTYPITWQLKIMQSFTELLERINPDNTDPATGDPYRCPDQIINPETREPYAWDFRKRVHRGKTILGNGKNESPPSITLIETDRPIPGLHIPDDPNPRIESLGIYIQGFAPDVAAHKSDSAYLMMGQVQQLLGRITAKDPAKGINSGLPLYPDDYLFGLRSGSTNERLLTDLTIGAGTARPPNENVSPTAFFYIPLVAKFKFDPLSPWAN